MEFNGNLYLTKEEFIENKHFFIFPNPVYKMQKKNKLPITVPETIQMYKKVGGMYLVPRYNTFFDIQEQLANVSELKIKIKSKVVDFYNSSQLKTIKAAKTALLDFGGAVIVAKTGEGKTAMAIKIITELKVKTLILVQRELLINQWKEALLQLTDLTESDIGLLKQGTFTDGKVIIASQQSLMTKTFGRYINSICTMKIQDETHRIGAEKFLEANVRFDAKYVLALSATPNRADKLEEMYFRFTSNNIIRHESQRSLTAQYAYFVYRGALRASGNPYIPYRVRLINSIANDPARNAFLLDIIKRKLSKRKMLILSERIDQLIFLEEHLRERFPDKLIVRYYGDKIKKSRKKEIMFTFAKGYSNELFTVLHVARDKKTATIRYAVTNDEVMITAEEVYGKPDFLRHSLKGWKKTSEVVSPFVKPDDSELHTADIILSLYTKFSEGINVPHLDCLLYATPFASDTTLEQSKGRIERFVEGKQDPLLVDIQDINNDMLVSFFTKRFAKLESLGVNNIQI